MTCAAPGTPRSPPGWQQPIGGYPRPPGTVLAFVVEFTALPETGEWAISGVFPSHDTYVWCLGIAKGALIRELERIGAGDLTV